MFNLGRGALDFDIHFTSLREEDSGRFGLGVVVDTVKVAWRRVTSVRC